MADDNEESDSQTGKNKALDFSFSKSAIADLPSTAVQSIHIENDIPVEVDDSAFVWHEFVKVTSSGTKIKSKTKVKRIAQTQSSNNNIGHTLKVQTSRQKIGGGAMGDRKQSKVCIKERVSAAANTTNHSPSDYKSPHANGGGHDTAAGNAHVKPVKANSQTKLTKDRRTVNQKGSTTKLNEHRGKHTSKTKMQSKTRLV